MDKIKETVDAIFSKMKNLDIMEKEEPRLFELLKETTTELTDAQLSEFIESVAMSYDKNKRKYLKMVSLETRRAFLAEQKESYRYMNIRPERFGIYSNATYTKYEPIFIEALKFWNNELSNINKTAEKLKPYINKVTGRPFDYVLIGSLFAQDLIKQQGYTWHYGKEMLATPKELAKFIYNNEPKLKKVKENTIYTIVNSTLSGTSKSIFKNNRQMKIISEYCKDNNINIESSEFKKHLES